MRKRLLIGGVLLVFLQLSLWALYRRVEDQPRQGTAATPFSYETVKNQAALAPDVPLERLDGSVLKLDQSAPRHLLLHFWASWCTPCRAELPALLELQRDLAKQQGPELLLVSLDDSWEPVRHFFPEGVPHNVVRDSTQQLRSAYDVSTLPDTFVLSNRAIVGRIRGARDWRSATALAYLRSLAAE